MWHSHWVIPDVSKAHSASIFRVKYNSCSSWSDWPRRCRHYDPLKSWQLLTHQHSITSQKTSVFIYSFIIFCNIMHISMPLPELRNDSNFNYYVLMKTHTCFITNLFLYCVQIFRKWDVGVWTGLIWLRIGRGGRHLWCGNEPSGSTKCGDFLD